VALSNGSVVEHEEGLPAGWTAWRPDVAPAACRFRATPGGLAVDAPQEPFAVGGVSQKLKGIEGGRAYAVEAVAAPQSIGDPYRAVMVRLAWLKADEPLHPAGSLVRGPRAVDGKLRFQDVLVAPKQADGAAISLDLKWPQGGSVVWERVSLRPTTPPPPRKVKIGTVYLRSPRTQTFQVGDGSPRRIDTPGCVGFAAENDCGGS
jgi:hypothetical protein